MATDEAAALAPAVALVVALAAAVAMVDARTLAPAVGTDDERTLAAEATDDAMAAAVAKGDGSVLSAIGQTPDHLAHRAVMEPPWVLPSACLYSPTLQEYWYQWHRLGGWYRRPPA